jgi:hypothetical protein
MSQDNRQEEKADLAAPTRTIPGEPGKERQTKGRTKIILGIALIVLVVAGFFIYQTRFANR